MRNRGWTRTMGGPPPSGILWLPLVSFGTGGELALQRLGVGLASSRLLFQALENHPLQALGDCYSVVAHRSRCIGAMHHQERHRGRSLIHRVTGKEPIGDAAEGVEIG